MRGPQREAISGSSCTTWLAWIARMPAQPLRAASSPRASVPGGGVGHEDPVGVAVEHPVARELGVAVAVARPVGDVLEPGQPVQLADERGRGGGEQVAVDLVVDADRGGPGRDLGQQPLDLALHLLDQRRGLGAVTGGPAQLLELGVAVVELLGRRQVQHRHPSLGQAAHHACVVGVDQHQVGLLGEDGVDARRGAERCRSSVCRRAGRTRRPPPPPGRRHRWRRASRWRSATARRSAGAGGQLDRTVGRLDREREGAFVGATRAAGGRAARRRRSVAEVVVSAWVVGTLPVWGTVPPSSSPHALALSDQQAGGERERDGNEAAGSTGSTHGGPPGGRGEGHTEVLTAGRSPSRPM